MSSYFYIALIVCTALVLAYTMRFQGATLLLGKQIAPDNSLLPTGLQDAITPPLQVFRNMLWPLLLVAVFAMGFFFRWYVPFCGIVATWFGSGIIAAGLPKSDSDYFRRRILAGLLRRRRKYESEGDSVRVEAIAEVIERIECSSGLPLEER